MDNMKGLVFVGTISNPHINGGAELPLYEIAVSEGKLSINTLQGWNALCDRADRRALENREDVCA